MNPKAPTAEKWPVVRAILAYLAEHSEAQDTVEGIVEWWLLEQKIKHHTAQVKDALAELVTKGWVLKHEGRDTRVHYRLNRRRSGDIRLLLKERSG